MVGDYNAQTNFPPKLLLTDTQVLRPHKVFSNNLSANIKLSKTQISKIGIVSEEFLDRPLGASLKTDLPLMKNVLKPLAKILLAPLQLTAAASGTDAGIHKKLSGREQQNQKWMI